MLQVRDDLRLKTMTVSHLYTFLTHLTSPSNLLGLNLKNRRTGDMWAPVSQQLMVEQPSDKTQAMNWSSYILTTVWVSHKIRKKGINVSQYGSHLAILLWILHPIPSKNAHISSLDSDTDVHVLLWSCCCCSSKMTLSYALAQFEFTVLWDDPSDKTSCIAVWVMSHSSPGEKQSGIFKLHPSAVPFSPEIQLVIAWWFVIWMPFLVLMGLICLNKKNAF